MAKAIATPSPEPQELDASAPAPLEFFRRDAIHDENQALLQREQMRWRLLGRWERIRLRFYVASLARQLQKAKYNQTVLEVEKLRLAIRRAKLQRRRATDDAERKALEEKIEAIIARARPRLKKLHELKPTYELFAHYAGWLEYEREHRGELKRAAEREKRVRAEMRKEAKWLEQILLDVFRKTSGCHHITTDSSGKEITRTPKFERSIITPNAHYFYLAASRRTLFGWRWLLPYGVTISRLIEDEVITNMSAATKRQVTPIWSYSGQLIFRVSRLDSPDALPTHVSWSDAMKFFPDKDREKLPYTIGANESRKFVWFDFAKSHHCLVAGKSGSGKSNLVNGIIGTLASTHSPDELRIVMIDMKGGVEFTHWEDLPHILGEVVKTVDGVKPLLERLVHIMDQRFDKMQRIKAKNINAYNKRVDVQDRFAHVILLIDEMNTFVGLKGGLTDDIHNLLTLLISKGRAVGFHLIAATQHPEVAVIPGRIKTNMDVRLCGAMPHVTASMIVLDSPDAANLPNVPGRFVAVRGLDTLTVQVPFISDTEIAGIVSSTRQAYPDVPEQLRDVGRDLNVQVWDKQRVLSLALDLLDGHLSGQRLHKLLGDESPGERALAGLCRELIEQAQAVGYLERKEDGSQWTVYKRGRAYHLKPRPDQPDNLEVGDREESASDQVSGQVENTLPAIEERAGAAAD